MEIDAGLLSQLKSLGGEGAVIVGIGNTLKGDDGAGVLVCQLLKERGSGRVIEAGTVPENYIQPIINKSPEILLIVDAIDFGGAGGSIKIFGIDDIKSSAISTHSVSPRLFIDVIRQSISCEVYFVGIQPVQTTMGEEMSNEVKEAVESLVRIWAG